MTSTNSTAIIDDKELITSLELSKKLKEMGVRRETQFVWETKNGEHYFVSYAGNNVRYDDIAAFTAAELMRLLPVLHEKGAEFYPGVQSTVGGKLLHTEYTAYYMCADDWDIGSIFQDRNEEEHELIQYGATMADALAKLLIYVVENKLPLLERKRYD